MNLRYLLADDVYIYPAANLEDGGADNSEENISTITDKFAIAPFVVKRKGATEEPFNLTLNSSGNLVVTKGECSIDGYYINVSSDTELSGADYSTNTEYKVVVRLIKDGSNHVRADGTAVIGPNIGQLECRGLQIGTMTKSEFEGSSGTLLELGGFTTDPDGKIDGKTIIINDNKYSFIDASTIRTEDGRKIQDWVQDKIDWVQAHIDSLNAYVGDELQASFKLEKVADEYHVRLYKKDGTMVYDVNAIDARTQVAPVGQETPMGTAQHYSTPGTFNGLGSKIARADHNHNSQYIMNKALTDKLKELGWSVDTQTLGTRLEATQFKSNNIYMDSSGIGHLSNLFRIAHDNSDPSKFNMTLTGNIIAKGTITGSKVYNAVWNDIAELYRKDNPDEIVEAGTVIAKVKGKDTYAPVSDDSRKLVVGVVSDSYGYLLGGDADKSEEENLKNYYPIALSGRVRVKVVQGAEIEEGDLLFASAAKGKASAYNKADRGTVIGKALESSDGTKDRILMQVMLG